MEEKYIFAKMLFEGLKNLRNVVKLLLLELEYVVSYVKLTIRNMSL